MTMLHSITATQTKFEFDDLDMRRLVQGMTPLRCHAMKMRAAATGACRYVVYKVLVVVL